MNFPIHSKVRFIILTAAVLFLSACGLWDNFTTYFNLYYNTSELFEKAEKQIKDRKSDIFSTEPPVVSGNIKSDLVKVIEKCSNLLQFNSQSDYVDDALMILGKSFYYQKNYQKALRKFNELLTNYPESDLMLEAKLWVGKCQMRLKKYDKGLSTLAEVRTDAIEEGEEEVVEESFIEEIVYKITIDDLKGAIDIANEFMSVSDDDEIKAEVWFEIGRLNMQVGEVDNAVTAFQNVFDYSPDFDLQFDAMINYGRALREAGRIEEALKVFEDMKDEDKYATNYADIDFEIAKTNRALGNIDVAVNLFTEVDTLYKSTPVAGAAKYELGSIFEENIVNLDSAAFYYKQAAASTVPKEYVEPAREKDRLFTRYINLRNKISKYDKQLFYAENPDEFVKDSIAYVQDSLAIAEEIAEIKELQAIWSGLDSLLNKQDTTGYFADTLKALDSLITQDSTLIRDSLLTKIRNPLPDDSLIISKFDSVYNDPVFARRRNQQNKLLLNQQMQQNKQFADQLPDTLKFKNNPPQRPKIPEDSLKTVLAKSQLEFGNLFLTELNMPDSAYWYYNNVLTNYPGTQYQANTIYALGSYYLMVDNKPKADSLFNVIYENYKNEAIVNAAADKLNKPFIDLSYDPAKDNYKDVEHIMLNGNYEDAVEQFYEIYRTYPESEYAAKSLYACGWILENNLGIPDSAAAIYDTLIAHYPTSVYVRNIAGKLSFYKQEKKRLEMAHLDSLNGSINLPDSSLDEKSKQIDNLTLATNQTDSTHVTNEDGGNKETPDQYEKKKLPKVKEPLWNPRKRHY